MLDKLFRNMPEYWVNYNINISLKNKYVYIENPKVACTSIKFALQKHELGDLFAKFGDRPVHRGTFESPFVKPYQLSNKELVHILTSSEYFIFTFVRHPYSRLLSCYLEKIVNNLSCVNLLAPYLPAERGPEEKIISFKHFIDAIEKMSAFDMDSHWRIQSKQIFWEYLKFDFVGKFERFDDDFEKVMKKIGIPQKLTQKRIAHATSATNKVKDHYDDYALSSVAQIYEEDFRNFNYKK